MNTQASVIPMNGKRVSGRELRRRLNAESALLRDKAVPAIGDLHQRVVVIESRLGGVGALLSRGFIGRLRWLLRGK